MRKIEGALKCLDAEGPCPNGYNKCNCDGIIKEAYRTARATIAQVRERCGEIEKANEDKPENPRADWGCNQTALLIGSLIDGMTPKTVTAWDNARMLKAEAKGAEWLYMQDYETRHDNPSVQNLDKQLIYNQGWEQMFTDMANTAKTRVTYLRKEADRLEGK